MTDPADNLPSIASKPYAWSPSTQGLYLRAIAAHLPADVVMLTSSEYNELLQRSSLGETPQLGKDGESVAYAKPTPPDPMIALRAKRNRLLDDSDWTQLADAPITAEQKIQAASYRQQLRDLPDSGAVILPSPPAFLKAD